ncbi:MAG: hypothetical protein WCI04_05650 [archaeon]
MLGFILSKMQMLLFAVGIAVVALMFYDFVSRIGLSEEASNLILTNSKLISDQLSIDGFSSFDTSHIPDHLAFGLSDAPFYYDLEFSKQTFGAGDNKQNILILRVLQHISNTRANPADRKIIAASSVATDATIILVDSNFLTERSPIDASYNKDSISLYPRAVGKSEVVAASPDGFAIVKEIKSGDKFLYIIPCASALEPNNCQRNILRVGCYKLKAAQSQGITILDSTQIDSAFNIATPLGCGATAVSGASASNYIETKSKNYNWADCKGCFSDITSTS